MNRNSVRIGRRMKKYKDKLDVQMVWCVLIRIRKMYQLNLIKNFRNMITILTSIKPEYANQDQNVTSSNVHITMINMI